jgi:cell division septum initiation protein DivIVA
LTIAGPRLIISSALEDFETIAQEVSSLGQRVSDLEERLERAEHVNTGLEEAALTTARALQEISAHWDKVYEAMRRTETMTTARRA